MKEILALKGVWKIYTTGSVKVQALRGIDFSIIEKDFLAIMGSSGSGKSTMLHLCGLLDKPTRGNIFIGNINTTTLSSDKIATIRNKKIGFIFQQFNLIPYLSAIENVILPSIFSETNKEVKDKAKKLLENVGLKGKENNKPMEMSGGEQQRVAIARALINDPEIILADEPTGNLDSKTGENIMNLLTELHKKQGKTLVVVTHDEKIAAYTNKLIKIKDGQIVNIQKIK